jgi:hypothetical protein
LRSELRRGRWRILQDAITGRVRDPPSMPPNELIDHGATGRQRFHRRFFIAVH